MTEWVVNTITSLGYVGIALLMFLENLFPPIPSELIVPLAGFTVAQGKMEFTLVVVAATIGTMLGALPWYFAGALLGARRLQALAERYGRWFGIDGKDIHKSAGWFERHGVKAVFFCRMVPGIRTFISVPAGIARMSLSPFLFFSTLGTCLWILFLAYCGLLLGKNYTIVDTYLSPISKFVLLGLAGGFAAFVALRQWQRSRVSRTEQLPPS